LINSHLNVSTSHLKLQFNVDGIPLFKSSSLSLWPILCLIHNIGHKEPFVVGLFCGKVKPSSASEFLSDFVADLLTILREGLSINGKIYSFSLHSFVCDAPARAFIKGIKSHSGYASCEKCSVHGEHDGKVLFISTNSPLRTDDSFDQRVDESHHVGISCPLSPLPVGCVTQFGLDYMHLICLGVTRRLLMYWKGPVGPLHVRLSRKLVSELSERLIFFALYCPVEFARKPRALDELPRWKATEFREFLLYSGPFILEGLLSDELYKHLMLLFVSIRILASKQQAVMYCDYASELLVKFVTDAEVLYGKQIMVYNVHCLIHLAEDVKRLGCLDEFSAFLFENKLGQLKKLVRKPSYPLQQILRRLNEQQSFKVTDHSAIVEPVTKFEHNSGPLIAAHPSAKQFKRVKTNQWSLSLKVGENCIMTSEGVPALVRNIVAASGTISLICTKFECVSEAFTYPLISSKLGICKVERQLRSLFSIPLSSVMYKCVYWPIRNCEDSFIVIPFLH
jgi:hypothetical protein